MEVGKMLVFLTNNFIVSCGNHLRALQESLAGGIVLQVDQAASAYQKVLRQFRECGEVTNLDRHVGLCPRCHHQEAPQSGCLARTLLQILSLTLFEKVPLQQAFQGNDYKPEQDNDSNQMNLFKY
jgi:hypothetical protein